MERLHSLYVETIFLEHFSRQDRTVEKWQESNGIGKEGQDLETGRTRAAMSTVELYISTLTMRLSAPTSLSIVEFLVNI